MILDYYVIERYFSCKQQTIHDLFEVDAEEADASKRMAEVLDRPKDDSRSADEVGSAEENLSVVQSVSKQALGVLESALAAAEDETDVAAARVVRAEVAAEMAEFDESAPINAADDRDNADADPDASRTEAEHEQKLRQLEGSVRKRFKFPISLCSQRIVEDIQ